MVGPRSAFQPFSHLLTVTFNFPWSLAYIRKLAFGPPCGNYFVCSQHTAPKNTTLAQTQLSQGTDSHLGRVELRRFISCALTKSGYASLEFEPRTSRSSVERATTGSTRPDLQWMTQRICVGFKFNFKNISWKHLTCTVFSMISHVSLFQSKLHFQKVETALRYLYLL